VSTRVRLFWCALSAAALTNVAAAQPADFGRGGSSRPVRIMLGGGATVPVGDFGKKYNDGYNLQGSLLFHFPGFPVNLRTDVSYTRLKLNDLLSLYSSSYSSASAELLGGLANLTVPLGVGPVRPYVMAGLGAFNVDPAQVAAETVESSVSFAINGGVGVQLRLLGLEAFVETRVHNVFTDEGIIDRKGIQMIPLTFGIIF
jgi:opacity protein-like surface antigen